MLIKMFFAILSCAMFALGSCAVVMAFVFMGSYATDVAFVSLFGGLCGIVFSIQMLEKEVL